jgi:hypothetical protein
LASFGNTLGHFQLPLKQLGQSLTEYERAETRRFELLKGLTPYLVSSEAHSTGLCDVSKCGPSLPPLLCLVNLVKSRSGMDLFFSVIRAVWLSHLHRARNQDLHLGALVEHDRHKCAPNLGLA